MEDWSYDSFNPQDDYDSSVGQAGGAGYQDFGDEPLGPGGGDIDDDLEEPEANPEAHTAPEATTDTGAAPRPEPTEPPVGGDPLDEPAPVTPAGEPQAAAAAVLDEIDAVLAESAEVRSTSVATDADTPVAPDVPAERVADRQTPSDAQIRAGEQTDVPPIDQIVADGLSPGVPEITRTRQLYSLLSIRIQEHVAAVLQAGVPPDDVTATDVAHLMALRDQLRQISFDYDSQAIAAEVEREHRDDAALTEHGLDMPALRQRAAQISTAEVTDHLFTKLENYTAYLKTGVPPAGWAPADTRGGLTSQHAMAVLGQTAQLASYSVAL